jgi:type VII secretion protein EccB
MGATVHHGDSIFGGNLRTTGLQVSGHAFLRRRLELALVTGDARMAHDPLRTQRRAVGVGVLIALLVAGGMVVLALLRPQPSIGDAGLVADESGALHVRLGDSFHPVTNVASARLLLGTAAEVTDSTARQLAEFPAGPPVGIPQAPGLVPADPGAAAVWALCGTTVVAADAMPDAGPRMLVSGSGHWLVVDGVRMRVPDGGPRVARALGTEPVELAGDEGERMVRVLDRGPDIALPSGRSGLPDALSEQGRLVAAGDRRFVVAGGGLAEVTGARRAVAEALAGEGPVEMDLGEVLAVPGSEVLAQVPVDLLFKEAERPCVGEGVVDGPEGVEGAAAYVGPRGTVALTTERGLVLVSESGVRYSVGSADELAALGVVGEDRVPVQVPWRVIEPLPDGGELSAERARRTVDVG